LLARQTQLPYKQQVLFAGRRGVLAASLFSGVGAPAIGSASLDWLIATRDGFHRDRIYLGIGPERRFNLINGVNGIATILSRSLAGGVPGLSLMASTGLWMLASLAGHAPHFRVNQLLSWRHLAGWRGFPCACFFRERSLGRRLSAGLHQAKVLAASPLLAPSLLRSD
jgi:hypothetical protein